VGVRGLTRDRRSGSRCWRGVLLVVGVARGWRARRGGRSERWLAGVGSGETRLRSGLRLAAVLLALALLALVVVAVHGGGERASAQTGNQMFVPDESDGPLLQPPVITSRNGVLRAHASLIRAGIPGSGRPTLFGNLPTYSNPRPIAPSPQGNSRPPHLPLDFAAGFSFKAYGRTLPAQFPAPTLRVRPGDILDLTSRDRLADEPTGPRLPPGAAIWNLHTHGLVTSPLADSDNVYRTMQPNSPYETQIKIQSHDASGIDWYHPHRHGYVADQVYGGLAGTLQVGDPLDSWPQYKGKYQERLLDLTAGLISVDDSGHRFMDDPNPASDPEGTHPLPYGQPNWEKFVNGQYNPTITIRPGETQIWTFSSMTRNGNFNLGITDRNGQNPWSATILSYDGDGVDLSPRPITLGLPVPYIYDGPTVLDPGARITMAVTAPNRPGTYYLADDMTLKLKPQQQFFALATINVTGAPATQPRPVFSRTGPVPDLFRAKPDHIRTFDFSNVTSGKTIAFAINGSLFPNGPLLTLQAGQVEQWLLVNTSPIDHTFHIHQNNFAVISVNSIPINYTNPFTSPSPYHYESLRDTVEIPPGGSVVIRFRVSPELGKYVFHCHILEHEDGGMMMAVLAIPGPTHRRIALGTHTGQRSAVFVKNGNGRSLRQIKLGPPSAREGVVTATGELTGDLTEDTVVGTQARAGSAASISVYDGKSLRRIARFRPFPGFPRAGLSLATGDVEGDGRADIIVGRVSPGPSLIRIFRANGKLLRTIKGTIRGRLPHGVSVASADFNGDNYDDVAVGAGRGAPPRVVALDGFTLLNRSRPARRLFSFLAPGGRGSGVSLAAGYYDPKTRPGLQANLITTPQTGRLTGAVQVWAPPPFEAPHVTAAAVGDPTVPGASPTQAAQAARAASPRGAKSRPWAQSSALLLYCLHRLSGRANAQFASLATRLGLPATNSSSPRLMTTLHPRGRHLRTGLNLAVTHLGKQGLDALAAWTNPRKPTYISIDNGGAVSVIRTPVS
jgi:FtsP/CotA-like multicopper oxidase with cupredoxin domain